METRKKFNGNDLTPVYGFLRGGNAEDLRKYLNTQKDGISFVYADESFDATSESGKAVLDMVREGTGINVGGIAFDANLSEENRKELSRQGFESVRGTNLYVYQGDVEFVNLNGKEDYTAYVQGRNGVYQIKRSLSGYDLKITYTDYKTLKTTSIYNSPNRAKIEGIEQKVYVGKAGEVDYLAVQVENEKGETPLSYHVAFENGEPFTYDFTPNQQSSEQENLSDTIRKAVKTAIIGSGVGNEDELRGVDVTVEELCPTQAKKIESARVLQLRDGEVGISLVEFGGRIVKSFKESPDDEFHFSSRTYAVSPIDYEEQFESASAYPYSAYIHTFTSNKERISEVGFMDGDTGTVFKYAVRPNSKKATFLGFYDVYNRDGVKAYNAKKLRDKIESIIENPQPTVEETKWLKRMRDLHVYRTDKNNQILFDLPLNLEKQPSENANASVLMRYEYSRILTAVQKELTGRLNDGEQRISNDFDATHYTREQNNFVVKHDETNSYFGFWEERITGQETRQDGRVLGGYTGLYRPENSALYLRSDGTVLIPYENMVSVNRDGNTVTYQMNTLVEEMTQSGTMTKYLPTMTVAVQPFKKTDFDRHGLLKNHDGYVVFKPIDRADVILPNADGELLQDENVYRKNVDSRPSDAMPEMPYVLELAKGRYKEGSISYNSDIDILVVRDGAILEQGAVANLPNLKYVFIENVDKNLRIGKIQNPIGKGCDSLQKVYVIGEGERYMQFSPSNPSQSLIEGVPKRELQPLAGDFTGFGDSHGFTLYLDEKSGKYAVWNPYNGKPLYEVSLNEEEQAYVPVPETTLNESAENIADERVSEQRNDAESEKQEEPSVAEEVIAEESRAQEMPAETVSVEQPVTETVSTEEMPVEESPLEDMLTENVPVEKVIEESVPMEEFFDVPMPSDEFFDEPVPVEENVTKPVPAETTSFENVETSRNLSETEQATDIQDSNRIVVDGMELVFAENANPLMVDGTVYYDICKNADGDLSVEGQISRSPDGKLNVTAMLIKQGGEESYYDSVAFDSVEDFNRNAEKFHEDVKKNFDSEFILEEKTETNTAQPSESEPLTKEVSDFAENADDLSVAKPEKSKDDYREERSFGNIPSRPVTLTEGDYAGLIVQDHTVIGFDSSVRAENDMIEIPNRVNGVDITTVSSRFFEQVSDEVMGSISKLYIPSTVESIESGTFKRLPIDCKIVSDNTAILDKLTENNSYGFTNAELNGMSVKDAYLSSLANNIVVKQFNEEKLAEIVQDYLPETGGNSYPAREYKGGMDRIIETLSKITINGKPITDDLLVTPVIFHSPETKGDGTVHWKKTAVRTNVSTGNAYRKNMFLRTKGGSSILSEALSVTTRSAAALLKTGNPDVIKDYENYKSVYGEHADKTMWAKEIFDYAAWTSVNDAYQWGNANEIGNIIEQSNKDSIQALSVRFDKEFSEKTGVILIGLDLDSVYHNNTMNPFATAIVNALEQDAKEQGTRLYKELSGGKHGAHFLVGFPLKEGETFEEGSGRLSTLLSGGKVNLKVPRVGSFANEKDGSAVLELKVAGVTAYGLRNSNCSFTGYTLEDIEKPFSLVMIDENSHFTELCRSVSALPKQELSDVKAILSEESRFKDIETAWKGDMRGKGVTERPFTYAETLERLDTVFFKNGFDSSDMGDLGKLARVLKSHGLTDLEIDNAGTEYASLQKGSDKHRAFRAFVDGTKNDGKVFMHRERISDVDRSEVFRAMKEHASEIGFKLEQKSGLPVVSGVTNDFEQILASNNGTLYLSSNLYFPSNIVKNGRIDFSKYDIKRIVVPENALTKAYLCEGLFNGVKGLKDVCVISEKNGRAYDMPYADMVQILDTAKNGKFYNPFRGSGIDVENSSDYYVKRLRNKVGISVVKEGDSLIANAITDESKLYSRQGGSTGANGKYYNIANNVTGLSDEFIADFVKYKNPITTVLSISSHCSVSERGEALLKRNGIAIYRRKQAFNEKNVDSEAKEKSLPSASALKKPYIAPETEMTDAQFLENCGLRIREDVEGNISILGVKDRTKFKNYLIANDGDFPFTNQTMGGKEIPVTEIGGNYADYPVKSFVAPSTLEEILRNADGSSLFYRAKSANGEKICETLSVVDMSKAKKLKHIPNSTFAKAFNVKSFDFATETKMTFGLNAIYGCTGVERYEANKSNEYAIPSKNAFTPFGNKNHQPPCVTDKNEYFSNMKTFEGLHYNVYETTMETLKKFMDDTEALNHRLKGDVRDKFRTLVRENNGIGEEICVFGVGTYQNGQGKNTFTPLKPCYYDKELRKHVILTNDAIARLSKDELTEKLRDTFISDRGKLRGLPIQPQTNQDGLTISSAIKFISCCQEAGHPDYALSVMPNDRNQIMVVSVNDFFTPNSRTAQDKSVAEYVKIASDTSLLTRAGDNLLVFTRLSPEMKNARANKNTFSKDNDVVIYRNCVEIPLGNIVVMSDNGEQQAIKSNNLTLSGKLNQLVSVGKRDESYFNMRSLFDGSLTPSDAHYKEKAFLRDEIRRAIGSDGQGKFAAPEKELVIYDEWYKNSPVSEFVNGKRTQGSILSNETLWRICHLFNGNAPDLLIKSDVSDTLLYATEHIACLAGRYAEKQSGKICYDENGKLVNGTLKDKSFVADMKSFVDVTLRESFLYKAGKPRGGEESITRELNDFCKFVSPAVRKNLIESTAGDRLQTGGTGYGKRVIEEQMSIKNAKNAVKGNRGNDGR